jgi:hypothetical protein
MVFCVVRWFSGDDLLAALRPRGLPIGNLTSQFWSNCYLDAFDHFVKRELRCPAYLRYVDDMALFSDSKRELWHWQQAVMERLAGLRLTIHPEAQVTPVQHGIPWLGFIVYPDHRRVKARNVRNFRRRLRERWQEYCDGVISFAEFDASVQGWINHVRSADTWGLRRQVLAQPLRSCKASSRSRCATCIVVRAACHKRHRCNRQVARAPHAATGRAGIRSELLQ